MGKQETNAKGFTLIELLIVIAVIAFLISIVVPALRKAKDAARIVICANNQKQLIYGVLTYQSNNTGLLPPSVLGRTSNYWECDGFWTNPSHLNYHSEKSIGSGQRDGLAGGWIGKYLFDYIPLVEVFNCPMSRVDSDASIEAYGNQSYQELYKNGQAWILPCSYFLFWNYNGFDHTFNENQVRFAGPGKHSNNTLLSSDALFWNEFNEMSNRWYCTHPFRSVKGVGGKTQENPWYSLYDPSETLPAEVKLNAGYVDGSVRRYNSKETVRGVLEIASYMKIYYPSTFK
jgi:prepilin-type N-terminal cleavage/methylation domain-containing protein